MEAGEVRVSSGRLPTRPAALALLAGAPDRETPSPSARPGPDGAAGGPDRRIPGPGGQIVDGLLRGVVGLADG